MLKTLIIDDEPLAHEVIKYHLQGIADIQIVAQCFDATEAMSFLANHSVDLLLLDINMPALSGIELLKVLKHRPQVILISAYKEYALEGFNLDVADYLLKPVSQERLLLALDKVRKRVVSSAPIKSSLSQHIVLKVDKGIRKFELTEVTLCEAYGNYVKLWQGNQMTLIRSTLKLLFEQLPKQQFMQVHKSYIINVNQVVAVENEQIHLSNKHSVKVGKSFKGKLPALLK
ncbi:LytR/AlgR family response regulator transcription factor [Paraglaciecola sp.]|uniref:LytR/AlgR family response regulator transcription factor n=1 Tax=Paraglaciecola sp. TaxID=1920173 RepID=UPI003EF2FF26